MVNTEGNDVITKSPVDEAIDAILDAVERSPGGTARASEVVRAASQTRPDSDVREAYWRLLSERRLIRSASGAVHAASR